MSVTQTDYGRLDAARWMAALAVVLLHCAAFPLTSTTDYGSTAWQWANVYDAATRWCVPVFVMISGALLLDPSKREGFRRFYQRRAIRILPAIVFWSALFLLWRAYIYRLEDASVDALDWLRLALSGEPYYHLWYLYMLVGLYLFTPCLRLLYSGSSVRQRLFMILVVFALATLQGLHREISGSGYGFFLVWFLPYIGYFMAGRMMFEGQLRLPLPGLVFVLAAALTAAGASALTTSESLNVYFYDAFSLTVPWMSLAVFQLILNARRLPRLPAVIPLTFGIYLVHPVFLDIGKQTGWYAPQASTVWQVPLTALIVFGLSMATVWVLRQVPGFTRLT
ncbi:acyltransferase family protein [Pusillimonas sp. CC-YST705]|uniref:Acyltransferase family protein n=1 Tax=Mesopusillimonas faecipullorum TaxID=2755040 RepID=A0ABS8CBQ6_9BURK|nr:acyltransferase family protein [Mesopusillimonas faecipullorum]MCB5363466.1 acyltransferase family protein [Mesopusillimonas faecipullorum]